jgi:hypothetical protein
MGYIKEPEGVDFIIQSEPLTDKDREQISKFIQEYKRKERSKKNRASTNKKEKNTAPNNA